MNFVNHCSSTGLTYVLEGIVCKPTCGALIHSLCYGILQVLQLDLFSVPPSLPVLQCHLVDDVLTSSAASFFLFLFFFNK